MNLLKDINSEILTLFRSISKIAEELSTEVYIVGGFVRDTLLQVTNKDLDFVVVGDGISFAKKVKESLNGDFIVTYNKFGTAKVGLGPLELEFVGARSEKYSPNSRKPIVEDADLASDLARRDFTINAMAIDLSQGKFGQLIDLYNGQDDLKQGIIKTPLEPNITFIDDPLRIMRAIRFATRFKYTIEEETYIALQSNVNRLSIISYERITEELKKTFESENPDLGLKLIINSGILQEILPEISEKTWQHNLKLFSIENIRKWAFLWKFSLLLIVEDISSAQLKKIGKRFKFSNESISLILYFSIHFQDLETLFKSSLNEIDLKHFLFRLGINYEDVIDFYSALIPAENIINIKKKLSDIDQNLMYSKFELAINGEDIQSVLAIPKGKIIGEIKDSLIESVLSNLLKNEKKYLVEFVKNTYGK